MPVPFALQRPEDVQVDPSNYQNTWQQMMANEAKLNKMAQPDPQIPTQDTVPEGLPTQPQRGPAAMPQEISMRRSVSAPAGVDPEALAIKQMERQNINEGLLNQKAGIDQMTQNRKDYASRPKQWNLSALNAYFDSIVPGSKLSEGYVPPETEADRQKQIMAYDQAIQKAREGYSDKQVDYLKALYADKQAKQTADALKIANKLTPGQQAADVAFGKEYQDWNAQGGYAGFNKNLSQLKDAAEQLKNHPELSGSVSASLPDAVRKRVDPKGYALQQQIEQAAQASLKATLGSQFTAQEGEGILHRVYDPALPASQNIVKLNGEIEKLERQALAKENASKYFEKTGSLRGTKASDHPASVGGGAPPAGTAAPSREEMLKALGGS